VSERGSFDDEEDEGLGSGGAGGFGSTDPADPDPTDRDPEKRLQATALEYEPGSTAPKVVASGSGHIAEQIIRAAQEAGVPVRSDPALASALAALDLGTEIPEELYRSVAETLAWAYRLDRKAAQG